MSPTRRGTAARAGLSALALLIVTGCSGDDQSSDKDTPGGGLSVPVIDVANGGEIAAGGAEVDTVTWAIAGDIQKFDPAVAYDFSTVPVVSQGCEGLLRFDDKGELIPNLATEWDTPDPLTYVYQVREGVTFWDGSEMTAEDVAFSLNRILDPETGAYMGAFYANVASIDVTGPTEVTVKLKQPDTQWKFVPAMTGSGAITSKAFVEAHPDDLGTPEVGNMCTGPFEFESWERDQQLKMTRFDDYWNVERTPKVKNLVFRVIPDESTVIAALNSGEVDGGPIYVIDGRTATSLSGNLNLLASPSSAYNALYFNTTRAPWDEQPVRQALALALDRSGIVSAVFNGLGEQIKSPIPPVMWTYEDSAFEQAYDSLPEYAQDIEEAKRLVEEAGASGATSTLMVDPGTNPKTALFVQQAAQAIGLDIKIETVPFTQKTSLEYADGPKDYDMTLLTWVADTPDPLSNILLEYNSANTVTNIASYSNPEVDKALLAAQGAETESEEAESVIAAQQLIMEDLPMIPIIAQDSLIPLNDRLTGFRPTFFSYWTSWAADLSGVE